MLGMQSIGSSKQMCSSADAAGLMHALGHARIYDMSCPQYTNNWTANAFAVAQHDLLAQ